MTDLRQQISDAPAAFTQRPLADAATALFETLGYRSEKRLTLDNIIGRNRGPVAKNDKLQGRGAAGRLTACSDASAA